MSFGEGILSWCPCVDRKEDQADVDLDPDEKDMEDMNLNEESVTGEWFLSQMIEGWRIKKLFYMLRGGMYT